ncbi:unnamed protein product [Leptidea sinapis]|uniref:Uncharacterized protein n=1 Tax=Leptidea sinapis TaxID=189913 RepID=A0A5E4PZD9_9NEOP|nr:unnamed protein product [Leptidea sinapis]
MALYTILFGISIFMIALVMAIIKKMFFHWKQEHKTEMNIPLNVLRPDTLSKQNYEKDYESYQIKTLCAWHKVNIGTAVGSSGGAPAAPAISRPPTLIRNPAAN